ncbi:hypothetical protein [Sulfuritalea sp.]|uniref:hypothetical protein n=1 Tax=Sulfuritalea sp. TaxID=2480090 RepID=UPI001AC1F4C9|nr:hypothetical protein [Sulfuritalea sp.]MBN8473559.1 hypothetical protein [Sulfuritalea sp.]
MNIASRIVPGLACLTLLAPAGAAETPELGRLFFTPERRLALERQRTHNVREAQTLQGTTMSLDGVVQRSSGKSTVWINRQAQNENDGGRTGVSAAVSAKTPGSALLAPGEEAPARLKVGEALNRATGERNTRLGGGVVVTPGNRDTAR